MPVDRDSILLFSIGSVRSVYFDRKFFVDYFLFFLGKKLTKSFTGITACQLSVKAKIQITRLTVSEFESEIL